MRSTEKNIFFSIIIPTYNSKNTIIKCIESCLNQSYKNFEIIIVDDYSTDNTIEMIENYKNQYKISNIIVTKLEKNQGPSVARNKGINLAQGEFIALLDSDDYFSLQKLEIVNKTLMSNSNIDLLGHNYCIDEDLSQDNLSATEVENAQLRQISCTKLLFKNFAVTPSIVFKKNISIRFNETMRYTEDHDFFLRVCLSRYKIYYLDIALVRLNRSVMSEGGQSSNSFKMRLGEMKMYLDLYKSNFMFIPFIPFLLLFSFVKHMAKIIVSRFSAK